MPWYAKLTAGCVAAYALSPIDLIPDFIPVIGYLDDLILVPLGIMAAVRMVPLPLMAEFRTTAASRERRPKSRIGAVAIIAIWVSSGALLVWVICLRRA